MTGKAKIRLLAVVLAVLMPLSTALVIAAESKEAWDKTMETKYESPDINEISGIGKEPEELSVTADAVYLEKAWYEYVTYSEKAVCSYRINDDSRLVFYDPYTYTNSLIMEVDFDPSTTVFDTMSEYTISHTNSRSISTCVSSTETNTEATTSVNGEDYTKSEITNKGTQTTTYNHSIENPVTGTVTETVQKNYKEYEYDTTSETHKTSISGGAGTKDLGSTVANTLSSALTGFATGGVAGALIGGISGAASGMSVESSTTSEDSTTINHTSSIVLDSEKKTTTYSSDYKTSTNYVGTDTVEDNTSSSTEGWTTLADRVTTTLGSSISTNHSWSETEGTTVTKMYAATHFSSDGVTPLPWAIVHYSVQMPMKCCMQVKYSGEWVTVSTVYCLLTTVRGTCRAWMQNGQVYYEDWGSGEPVVESDFWSNFMTKESLVKAYESRLYPTGGND